MGYGIQQDPRSKKMIHGLVFRNSFGLLSPLISGDLMVRIPPKVIPMGKIMGKTAKR
jgi:hypothetical protein